jgi:hypothetical protein
MEGNVIAQNDTSQTADKKDTKTENVALTRWPLTREIGHAHKKTDKMGKTMVPTTFTKESHDRRTPY